MRIQYLFVGLLLAVLPWNPFLSTVLSNVIPNFTIWKELTTVLIILLSLPFLWQQRRSLPRVSLLIIAFALLSGLTGLLFTGNGFPDNITQIIWGAKYGILFLLLIVAVQALPWTAIQIKRLVSVFLISATGVVTFSLAQQFIFPEDFLTNFNYSPEYGNTEAHLEYGAPSYCHKIENSITHEEFCRLQGTLSGPNQYGAYLLLVLGVSFGIARFAGFGRWRRAGAATLFVMASGALVYTWSRSAFIGALVAGAAYFVSSANKPRVALLYLLTSLIGVALLFLPIAFGSWWWNTWQIPGSIACIGLIAFLTYWSAQQIRSQHFSAWLGLLSPIVLAAFTYLRWYRGDFLWNIFLRPSSSQGHFERMRDGIQTILQHPLGLGLGDAGPASARFAAAGETGFLPESWYLQVGLESGILGLILFVVIMTLLITVLLRSSLTTALGSIRYGLGLSFVALATAAIFLHIWESAVVALSFALLAGILLSSEQQGTTHHSPLS